MCVCACVRCACFVCIITIRSSPRSNARSRDAYQRLRSINVGARGGGGGCGRGGVCGGGARACVCVLCAVVFIALLLDRAREATRVRATQSNDCARSTAMCVVVAVVVACVVVACVRVAPSLLDRAREATRDRATHSKDCARSTAICVVTAAVVAVAAACVAAARACVCCVYSPSLLHRAREATRDRATHINDCVRSVARCAAAVVVAVVAACVVAARVCVCFVAHPLIYRARAATRDRATRSNDCARSTAICVAAAVVVAGVAAVSTARLPRPTNSR